MFSDGRKGRLKTYSDAAKHTVYAKNLQDISAPDRLEQKHKTARVNLPKKFKRN
ncbi:hypothetical protein ACG2K1_04715 [Neisseria sp. 23W00296]|uniref:hypothetical protein n=1 Tax=unclassified Neisseria TaxID=2623750 RepID=UPI0003487761|nr:MULTISPECIES: hypothetical protein [unclassified Neisseria]